jgi:hypothetical protein
VKRRIVKARWPGRYSAQSQSNFIDFLQGGRYRNRIKTRVVKRLIMFQHAMDGVEQFSHDRADCLHGFLAVIDEVLKIGLDMGSCCFALKAGIYRAERIWRLPALERRTFLCTLLPDSNALGSSPANLTHSRWDKPAATRPSKQWRWFRQYP